MERVFGDGRTCSFCRPSSGRRGYERCVPGVRDFAQDRLQDRSIATRRRGWRRSADRSRRPVRYANQLPDPDRADDRGGCKRDKPHWGARKIRELLVRRLAGDVRIPARSTVHAVLDRHGLVAHARQRRRCKAEGTRAVAPDPPPAPNDLWCADFKGEFKLGNGRYCYPLTVSDQASRSATCAVALADSARSRRDCDELRRHDALRGYDAVDQLVR